MTSDGPGRDAADRDTAGDDLRASALVLVRYLLRLRLPRAKWEQVTGIIDAAIAAAAADDLAGLRKATNDLMLISPVRVVKGDGGVAEPAGQRIFERANVLIDHLQPMRPAVPEDEDGKVR